jgi:hypothetical protein
MSQLGQNRISSLRGYVFRFAPESGHRALQSACLFRAKNRLMHHSISKLHSITLSARLRSNEGTERFSNWAVLRLMTSSKLLGCSTGISAGLIP